MYNHSIGKGGADLMASHRAENVGRRIFKLKTIEIDYCPKCGEWIKGYVLHNCQKNVGKIGDK